MGDRYPIAISMIFGYSHNLDNYSDQEFHLLLVDTRDAAKSSMKDLCNLLEYLGVEFYPVGRVGQNEETLTGDFPLKTAATRAGLGWIGKNGLLVTEQFGPRVRLEAILVDMNLPINEPVTRSHCGDCNKCVENCPIGCLKNMEWQAGMDRNKIIDVCACADYRKSFVPTLGRRLACGMCALACPKGLQID